jgi:Na+-transporting methylmalonyl-CoA/oxaloacetate decarboxylase gamma subunit
MVDPSGAGMAVIAMSVVFSALALLYAFFKNVAKLYTIDYSRLFSRKKVSALEKPTDISIEHTGEVNAAIAMALHLYRNQLHDHENTVLTIRKVSRTYSPWSSKIYGVLNNSR